LYKFLVIEEVDDFVNSILVAISAVSWSWMWLFNSY